MARKSLVLLAGHFYVVPSDVGGKFNTKEVTYKDYRTFGFVGCLLTRQP
jgi:hypothetical protein